MEPSSLNRMHVEGKRDTRWEECWANEGAVAGEGRGGGSPASPLPYWEMSSVSLSVTFPRNSTRGGAAIVFKSCPFSNIS